MSSLGNRDTRIRILRWVARIWSLPAIFFAVSELIFSSSDPGIEEGWLAWATVVILFLSVIGLLIAWWRERFGGWMSVGALLLFFILYWMDTARLFPGWGLLIAFIAVPAILYLVFDYYHYKYFVI